MDNGILFLKLIILKTKYFCLKVFYTFEHSSFIVNIIGSIDNAAIWNTTYHLIFSDNEMYQFLVMTGKEKRSDLFQSQMANPSRLIPVEGVVSNYTTTKQEVEQLTFECISKGEEIEKNIDKHIHENPPEYSVIEYTDIKSVELASGNAFSLPHVEFETAKGKMKFHLVHSNYEGRGKLPDDIFNSYLSTLKAALGDRLVVKD